MSLRHCSKASLGLKHEAKNALDDYEKSKIPSFYVRETREMLLSQGGLSKDIWVKIPSGWVCAVQGGVKYIV